MKALIAAVAMLGGTMAAYAEDGLDKLDFPNFALGYWKVEVSGFPSYTIAAELLEDNAVYRAQFKGEEPCIYAVSSGDEAGTFRYTTPESGGECNSGVFKLSSTENGNLRIHWSRPGASGTHTLYPDEEKMGEYRQATGQSKQVLNTSEIEGEWSGELVVGGMIRSLEVSLSATASGARLELDGLTVRCKTMIHPSSPDGIFDTFLYEKGSCSESKVGLQKINENLEMTIVETGKKAMLRRVSGPAEAETATLVPVTFRNIALGMSLADIEGVIEGKPRITGQFFLPYDLNAGSFMGVANLPFLDADYRTVHYPLMHEKYPPNLDEDNIAAYAVAERIAALFRVYTPVSETAPSIDAFKNALLNAYGEPSIESGQGSRKEFQWHYGLDGKLLSPQQARMYCVAKGRSDNTNSRQIGMRYRWYEQLIDLSVHKQNKAPAFILRPVNGCGTSVIFVMTSRNDESVREIQSVAFEHQPVASAIWEARKSSIDYEIRERISLQSNREAIAPKL